MPRLFHVSEEEPGRARTQGCMLHLHELPAASLPGTDASVGCHTTTTAMEPTSCQRVDDPRGAVSACGAELRVEGSL